MPTTIPSTKAAAMSDEQAAWIREHAWRHYHRKTCADTAGYYRVCACQYGSCGYCSQLDEHHNCTHEHHAANESPAAYLTDRRGSALVEVWEIGHRHVWRCACKTAGHHGRMRPTQEALF